MDADLGEFRQQRLELLPDPAAEVFAGGVFQAWNIVQIIVVELLVDRLEDRLDFREVADPAGMRIDLAFDVDGDTERVAVQAPAFVARKPSGRLAPEARCAGEDGLCAEALSDSKDAPVFRR